jgi:hypothetical protein
MRDWVRSEGKSTRSCDIVVQSVRMRQELRDPEKLSACNRICETSYVVCAGVLSGGSTELRNDSALN